MTLRRFEKILLMCGVALLVGTPGAACAKDLVIHAGTLLDGTTKPPRSQVSILVTDDRVTAIQAGFVTPPGAEVVDLRSETVLPGLIDVHTHMGGSRDLDDGGKGAPPAVKLINVIRNNYVQIKNGFTSVRDLGTLGVDYRSIIAANEKGKLVGPRIFPSLEALGPTGGHSDPWNGYIVSTVASQQRERSIIHGPDDAREKVREHIRQGAKVIKIMVSGGVSSLDDDPAQMPMTDEEVKAVVDTAHALGVRVAAHASGLKGIMACIRLGCDTIEHGSYADENALKLMKQRGMILVSTPTVALEKLERLRRDPNAFDPRIAKKGRATWPRQMQTARLAHSLGVKIAMGSDTQPIGEGGVPNATGLQRLVEAGMTNQEAIVAATGIGAEAIGSAEIGVIEPGRFADIISVKGDPLKDITTLKNVDFVMKGGQVIKKDGRMVVEIH